MTDQEVLLDLLQNFIGALSRTISGLPLEALRWQPGPEANNVAVTVWHVSRAFDLLKVRVLENGGSEAELWFTEGWAARTGYDPRGIGIGGFGNLSGYEAEVAAVPILPAEELLAYFEAAANALYNYLQQMPAEALPQPPRLGGTASFIGLWVDQEFLLDSREHLGEIKAIKAMWERKVKGEKVEMRKLRPFMTRREFIKRVAQAGGSAYAAMVALDLLKVPPAKAFALAGQVNDKKVIILGAGLAGMCAAYELGKLGYECQLLEARSRPGGRCWTVRRGTEEMEIDGPKQVATFDEGLYFNPGPARIPQHHHSTLGYAREFGLAVEIFTNVNEGAYYYTEGSGPLDNQPIRIRQAKADIRGYVSELLAKAVRQDLLDQPLTKADQQRLLQFLDLEGALTPDHRYQGSARRGYETEPAAGLEPGSVAAPHELSALIQAGFGSFFSLDYEFDQQMTMLQLVGGTDQLAQAFAKRLEGKIQYEAEVQEIRQTPTGVRIIYRSAGADKPEAIEGDFCICTLPLPVLQEISADFSAEMQEAIRAVYYVPTGKIGLQFSRRFWEEDEQIFGGISRTNLEIQQIWYPSSGYLSRKGILLGYYNFENQALRLGQLTPAEREAEALAQGRKIHPQYDETFESSFSVSWHKVRYTLGGFAFYTDFTRETYYPILNQPQGAIYLAGEHVSYLTGWMAGALESAQRVATLIHERALKDK